MISPLGACCLAVCAAASFRGSARPFAFLMLLHWAPTQFIWRAFGDPVYVFLMPRDIVLGALAAWLAWRRPSWSRVVIVLCLACMSLAHVVYWAALGQGVYVGETYMDALNILFSTALLALAFSAGRGAYDWVSHRLCVRVGGDRSRAAIAGAKRR